MPDMIVTNVICQLIKNPIIVRFNMSIATETGENLLIKARKLLMNASPKKIERHQKKPMYFSFRDEGHKLCAMKLAAIKKTRLCSEFTSAKFC